MARDIDAGRRERFEAVFEAYYRAVSAYALRRAGPAEAEDAVAETFLVAWRRLEDVPANAKPWLFGVTRRVLANQRRATARRAALTERLAREGAAVAESLQRPPVLQALERLSDRDREVLLLVAWEGLSTNEAATTLDCSRTAAKVRLHRARRRLRAQLQLLERLEAAPMIPTPRLEECHEE